MRSHKSIRFSFVGSLLLLSIWANGQAVLDAPFVSEKWAVHQPFPEAFNDLGVYQLEVQKIIAPYLEEGEFYKTSYIYHEFEYSRSRVLKYLPFSHNPHLTGQTKKESWVYTKDRWYKCKDWEGTQIDMESHNTKVELALPFWVSQFIGVNVKEAAASQNARSHWNYKQMAPQVEDAIKHGFVEVDKVGMLRKSKPYNPELLIKVLPFQELLKSSIEQGALTGYKDRFFTKRMSNDEFKKVLQTKLSGIRIKEDYFYDIYSGQFTSRIIGLGIVGEDTQLNNEIVWIYYPELRWAMMNHATKKDGIVLNYEKVFDQHIYYAEINEVVHPTPYYRHTRKGDYQNDVKHLPLTYLKLHTEKRSSENLNGQVKLFDDGGLPKGSAGFKNNVPEGKVTLYHLNGKIMLEGVMKDGWCNGEFKFYHDNGKLMATRNYVSGRLNGEQKDYHRNGRLYAVYTAEDFEPISLKRYHPSGKLMEEGQFQNGLPFGLWKYWLDLSGIDNEASNKIIKDVLGKSEPLVKGLLYLEVEYEHNHTDRCPPNYTGVKQSKMKRVCCNIKKSNN